jgi:sugar lactone lactonase YvrE
VIVFLLTLGVAYLGVNASPRSQSIAIQDSITVREWVTLPDDDAYPSSLALDDEGNMYTGSYVSGTVWRITPDGALTELAHTRDTFGSIAGLVWAEDGLYVLDQRDALLINGMTLWRWTEGAEPEKVAESNDATHIPYDLARDKDGNFYVSNVGQGPTQIVRYAVDGTGETWWTAPDKTKITGIAYDEAQDRLIAVDTLNSNLYSIPRSNPGDSTVFYEQAVAPKPGFDDADVAPDGTIYLAAVGLNRVAALTPAGELTYLAGAFRQDNRVVYDATRKRLYVNNTDQKSLVFDQVLFVNVDVLPKLPFALDVIEWK